MTIPHFIAKGRGAIQPGTLLIVAPTLWVFKDEALEHPKLFLVLLSDLCEAIWHQSETLNQVLATGAVMTVWLDLPIQISPERYREIYGHFRSYGLNDIRKVGKAEIGRLKETGAKWPHLLGLIGQPPNQKQAEQPKKAAKHGDLSIFIRNVLPKYRNGNTGKIDFRGMQQEISREIRPNYPMDRLMPLVYMILSKEKKVRAAAAGLS